MGGARLAGEQRHFAHRLARADATDRFVMTVRRIEVGDEGAGLNEVHGVARIARPEQQLTRRERAGTASRRQGAPRRLVKPGQQRQRGERVIGEASVGQRCASM